MTYLNDLGSQSRPNIATTRSGSSTLGALPSPAQRAGRSRGERAGHL